MIFRLLAPDKSPSSGEPCVFPDNSHLDPCTHPMALGCSLCPPTCYGPWITRVKPRGQLEVWFMLNLWDAPAQRLYIYLTRGYYAYLNR